LIAYGKAGIANRQAPRIGRSDTMTNLQQEQPTAPRQDEFAEPVRRIRIFGREFAMPRSRLMRIILGCLLVILGCFGFLPILGFWMIPLGLLILSYEFAAIRRWRRRTAVWWAYRNGRGGAGQPSRHGRPDAGGNGAAPS
jgi:hypothetical protein